MPEYEKLSSFKQIKNNLRAFYFQLNSKTSESGFALLLQMLEYNPLQRVTAEVALNHPYFTEEPRPSMRSFEGTDLKLNYPLRKIQEDKIMSQK